MFYVFQAFILLAQRLMSGSTNTSLPKTSLITGRNLNGSLGAALPVQVQIAITQNNVNLAIDSLLKISDPTSREYGQHWSAQKVATNFAPPLQSRRSVADWLSKSGVPMAQLAPSHARGHFLIHSTVGEVERIFNVTCSQGNDVTNKLECTDYAIPESVSHLVDYVTISSSNMSQSTSSTMKAKRGLNLGTHSRRQTQGKFESLNATGTQVNCSLYTTPSCLRDLYNIPATTAANTSNTFGVYEPAWMTWLPDDLDEFFGLFQPNLVGQRPVIERIDGGYLQTTFNLSIFNLEPDLDFQYALALTNPTAVLDIQVGDEFVLGDPNNMLAAFDK